MNFNVLKKKLTALALCALLTLSMAGCSDFTAVFAVPQPSENMAIPEKAIPEYEEKAEADEYYIEVNGNEPYFEDTEPFVTGYEFYSELDELGRCGVTEALIGPETMPTEERGSIGMIKPTGWHTVKYDFVDGKYLYNRCHLIGFQLAGENANEKNLITGTRHMNAQVMLDFENQVADYVRETGNHVMYRVTPVFEGDDLVAKGVQMEAKSVEDDSVSFNVFVYNVEPGVEIDYATGDSREAADDGLNQAAGAEAGEIRGNKRSKIYHCPRQQAYEDMADSDNLVVFDTEEEAREAGYRRAQR